MSRLGLLTWGMRHFVKPHLARASTPAHIRAEFTRAAGLFRAPPFLLHLPGKGPLPLDQISVGQVSGDRVILYFHGGAYIAGSPATHAALLGRLSKLTGLRVIAPAYRLAPEHPAPAAFEDACTAHQMLLDQGYAPDQIILGGESAGGGLALALLADLCARGVPPAAVFALSPWTDLALTGESLTRNADADPLFPVARIEETAGFAAGGLDRCDPRISPLYASFVAPPPVLIQVGTSEIIYDDSRRMADVLRQAGGDVTLSEWPDVPHVWQMFDGYIPQARQALCEVADFLKQQLTSPSRQRPDES
ncbi:alpha/beta hydrolase [Pseudorhodobacter turbinis]|uniref:Alpha/beta hydrolase n=1 Tax=Pseudorhodobacter turbinis TaxID=2500533 RepID=A0A4V1E101_9RHOB|nr:alpha/beta hydrolase [Pseudorhodobacter turbinis]QCO56414.1 alpha/beta hydrolase [Pseudorhodobacter turbinis]